MYSVDSLRLYSALNMPLKQIQRLSLQQTEIIDKFTHSIPECFRDFIAISPNNALLGISALENRTIHELYDNRFFPPDILQML